MPTVRHAAQAIGMLLLIGFRTSAASFATLHDFNDRDGALPYGGLVLSGNTLFGTTSGGGCCGFGTVFRISVDGTGFTNLYVFTGKDGANPLGNLIVSSETLYGTTVQGGAFGQGTVFRIGSDGTGFGILHNFTALSGGSSGTNGDGAGPFAGLIQSGSTLYGTAYNGGNSGLGTVYGLNLDGSGFNTVHDFTWGDSGASPRGALALSRNSLYGTGDVGGYGTIAGVNIDGTGFTNLYSLGYVSLVQAGLVLYSNWLYGTEYGTSSDVPGTVYRVNTDGTGFTILHGFIGPDGSSPYAALILSADTLYGTTFSGGSSGVGTVFMVNLDGTGFNSLYSFNSTNGANPYASLVHSENTLYGTTSSGGATGNGTIFALSLGPIPLNYTLKSNVLVFSWGNPAFVLQACPTVNGLYTNVTGASSPFTNAAIGPQLYLRLKSD